jgi:hypothetical protein
LETHPSVRETLLQLQGIAPGAPLLALGQTVFWDEPLKAALPILARKVGIDVSLIAGIHDTDYFAKLPGGLIAKEPFVALPKNDGSTKGFWSAAGEFSSLFGGEVAVTKEQFARAGVSLDKWSEGDISKIDEATEAYGWRGIASTDSTPQVAGEISLGALFAAIQRTFDWALTQTVDSLCEPKQRAEAVVIGDRIHAMMCDAFELCSKQTLGGFYECLLPELHRLLTSEPSSAEFTRTTKLLLFNSDTASLPRFEFIDLFLRPETSELACEAYNQAVEGEEVYSLDRFGTGAIPFDLVIPGIGRGTIRLTSKSLIVMTPTPKFVSLSRPVQSVQELAAIIDKNFPGSALVGKAVTLISQLSREFVFAFNEGASMYVRITRKMNNNLARSGISVRANPILRIAWETWNSLDATDRWFHLPHPFQNPFGAEHVSAETFSKSWREVVHQQKATLELLHRSTSPASRIQALHRIRGGRWECLAREFETLAECLKPLKQHMDAIRAETARIYSRLRILKQEWRETERAMGEHFRQRIRAKDPDSVELAKRTELTSKISAFRAERRDLQLRLQELRKQAASLGKEKSYADARNRRREIVREAEYATIMLVREAVISTKGLEHANNRPASWWMSVVSPTGAWFRRMLETVRMRLEPLVGDEG